MDHNESCCIFDTTQYTGVPDSHPCPHVVDVPALIRRLDALYAAGREAEAGAFLEDALGRARQGGDWRAELSMLSEMMGQYRYVNRPEEGLFTMIIREHYLNQIRPFYDSDLIKVITGIRRCGKSVILSQIEEEIRSEGKRAGRSR